MQDSTSGATVVIVDDDHRIRESLVNLLHSRGLAVCSYSSAADFLQSDALDRAQCVISDVVMPGMSGFELCSLLSRRRPGLPVILISGRAHEFHPQAGVNPVPLLHKPLDGDELMREISAALARHP